MDASSFIAALHFESFIAAMHFGSFIAALHFGSKCGNLWQLNDCITVLIHSYKVAPLHHIHPLQVEITLQPIHSNKVVEPGLFGSSGTQGKRLTHTCTATVWWVAAARPRAQCGMQRGLAAHPRPPLPADLYLVVCGAAHPDPLPHPVPLLLSHTPTVPPISPACPGCC